MVKGLDIFQKYFEIYTDQYVLIGGAACDVFFEKNDMDFRATRDLDVVLIVEAQTKEFGQKFWQFLAEGEYENKAKSGGKPQFYRFSKPQKNGFPAMIELFARTEWILEENAVLAPIHIDDSVSSLSAILLDDTYYEFLISGRDVIGGVSVLKPTWILPFKVKAWLDLKERKESGEQIDSRDIKKHRNDILRIASELVLETCTLPEKIKLDMKKFTDEFQVTPAELKNLKITGITEEEIRKLLIEVYHL